MNLWLLINHVSMTICPLKKNHVSMSAIKLLSMIGFSTNQVILVPFVLIFDQLDLTKSSKVSIVHVFC